MGKETTENVKEVVRWVYIGRRAGRVKGAVMAHVYLDEHEKDMLFVEPLGDGKHSDIIGGVYEGMIQREGKEGNRVSALGEWKWCHQSNDPKVPEWEALDEAALVIKRRKDQQKRAAGDKAIYERLDPIKAAYNKTNTIGRRAILAQVIEYITR